MGVMYCEKEEELSWQEIVRKYPCEMIELLVTKEDNVGDWLRGIVKIHTNEEPDNEYLDYVEAHNLRSVGTGDGADYIWDYNGD